MRRREQRLGSQKSSQDPRMILFGDARFCLDHNSHTSTTAGEGAAVGNEAADRRASCPPRVPAPFSPLPTPEDDNDGAATGGGRGAPLAENGAMVVEGGALLLLL